MSAPRIVSLWDMLQFRADIIAPLSHMGALWEFIGKIEQDLPNSGQLFVFSHENRVELLNLSVGFREEATKLNFVACASASKRLEQHLLDNDYPWDGLMKGQVRSLHQMVGLVMGSFTEEAQGRTFYVLTPAESAMLQPEVSVFGEEVDAKFGAARDDLEECMRCLAFDRSTAAVFHLMRAMEVALRTLSAKMDATIQDKDGVFLPWGVMAQNLKGKIDALPKGDDQTGWYRVHALFETLNRAWRNQTMHPKQSYSGQQATDVFEAVRSFLRHLAPLV